MWNIRKTVKKGDYLYAVVPEHPKATKNNYVLLHRVIMENSLGRILSDEEVVHHKDHNKYNNDIDNLEILTKVEHNRRHGLEQGRMTVILRCPVCGKEFVKAKNQTHLQKKSKFNCTCCSPVCRGKLSRYIQLYGMSDELQKAIDNNIVSEYKAY